MRPELAAIAVWHGVIHRLRDEFVENEGRPAAGQGARTSQWGLAPPVAVALERIGRGT
jgi:hypothetical protein